MAPRGGIAGADITYPHWASIVAQPLTGIEILREFLIVKNQRG